MIPEDLKYTEDHEWVRIDGLKATVGITHHAQDQLGDIVFVEVPDVGAELEKGDTFGVVESVKTVSDLYAPISGKVVEHNEKLVESSDSFEPEIVNSSPYGDGWMIVIEVADESALEGLLDHNAYKALVDSGS
ncbi:MAG: glycine cleavage system protein GcvH [Candidatus Eremiobacteraeota bacterium]|nr:glycine cleavage system protein GcvH [Candidatus Eremiobacteraeota bacterium]